MDPYALKSVSDLPAQFHSFFSFRYFNSLQSECFSTCFHSDINMVISAPTGSGKTVLFELCILRLLSRFISADGRFVHIKGTLKTFNTKNDLAEIFRALFNSYQDNNASLSPLTIVIYIAPSKALVQEKLRDWNQKLGSLGLNCLELTGDNEFYNSRNIQEADLILTTPEKFDAVTRYRIKDGGLSFFGDIALLLIDEVHLLNDPRGAALEAIVSRIKILARKPEMKSSPLANIRFLAVSATIPNVGDLAEWLMVPSQGIKRFGEEMRPVKLTTKVFGYAPAKNDFLFEKRLQNYIFDILMQFSRGKSALVFCSTRKGASEAAQRLSQMAMTFGHSNPFIKDREQHERLREASMGCSDKQMQSYILYGVGYHNGGLSLKDRNLVESLFLNGDVQVLCTTNTLAHGINLPAHTVVIKSTQHFHKEKGMYLEYDRSMILQMCGRAGRPPFDDTGLVIIMTRRETVHLYENLLSGCELVESQLLPCMTEHLTAEIVQLTISDITRAIEWMECSYLYVRMKKNPDHYAAKKGIPSNCIETYMQDICVQKVNELARNQMVWTDEDGFLLKPLEPGKLMTKYYLRFNTMKNIMKAPADSSIEDALHVICRAEEISWIQLRRNEKKLLNDVNNDKDGRLRFHILGDKGKKKKRIQTREEKIFILANDCLTGDPTLHDLTMNQDMTAICGNGGRIAKCMKEFFFFRKNYKGALNAAMLAKSLHQKLWDDSPYLLKQLPGIGMVTAKALLSMGVSSFQAFSEADPRKIEMVTGRKYPFGNQIKESLLSLPPKAEITLEETERQRQGKSKLVVTLTRISEGFPKSTKHHYADMVVALAEDNLILFHEKIRVEDFSSPYSATVLVPYPQQEKHTVKADLIFEDFIGVDLHEKFVVKKMNDSNVVFKHGIKHLSCFPNPKDICIIDDAKDHIQTSSGAPKKLPKSKNSKEDMPSFNLLDEEFEEGCYDKETEDDDCKIITEKTVFDHIREKAKSFPALAAPTAECAPTSEALLHIRKRRLGKHLKDENASEFLEREINEVPPSHMLILYPEQDKHDYPSVSAPLSTSVSYDPVCNADNTVGKLLFESEETQSNTLTGETIFEHIRKKAKSFPIITKSTYSNTEPLILKNELFPSHEAPVNSASLDKLELNDANRYCLDGQILATAKSRKQESPKATKTQCYAVRDNKATSEVDSYLGFRSIFSFL